MRALILCICTLCLPLSATFAPANRPIDVQNYKITLKLDPRKNPKAFDASVDITLTATQPIQEFELDRLHLAIHRATLLPGGVKLKIDVSNAAKVKIHLPYKVAAGANVPLRIEYQGKIGDTQEGLFRVTDPDDKDRGTLLFTQFEPTFARAFFPSNDEPADKATTEMIVTVPQGYEALSNGRIVADMSAKVGRDTWRTVHWALEKPHSTYLVALAVGRFTPIRTKYKDKEIVVWGGARSVDKARYLLESTARSMAFFEDFMGVEYPWPQYATVLLPTFIWGGMENTSSTHMNQDRGLLNDPKSEREKMGITGLAAHELAHQWFGDYATLKWWDDLWLNETFASYLGSEAEKAVFDGDEVEIARVRNAWDKYFRQENGPRSHPIVDKKLDSAEESFDAISYTKGENVIRMLEHYVGREAIRQGLKKYLTRFAFSNATYQDFFDAISSAAGKNLNAFRDSWLLERGYPIVSHETAWDAAAKKLTLTVRQKPNHDGDKTVFAFRLPVVLHRRTAPVFHQTLDWEIQDATQTRTLDLPAAPEWITINERSVVLAKVIQGQRDEASLSLQALYDPDSLVRVRAAYDLADPLLEGKGPLSPIALSTLDTMLREDTSPYVRIALLQSFQEMKSRELPKALAHTVLAQTASHKFPVTFSERAQRQWRAALLGTLGKISDPSALALLQKNLATSTLALDELEAVAFAVAAQGTPASAGLLKSALSTHGTRGYRYRYVIEFAFGALEHPSAAQEIRAIFARCTPDLVGKMSRVIGNNQTLKKSPQWARVLEDFVLHDRKQGDEVKSRLLQTVEEVRNEPVRKLLEHVEKKTDSPRIKGLTQKMLKKNFPSHRFL